MVCEDFLMGFWTIVIFALAGILGSWLAFSCESNPIEPDQLIQWEAFLLSQERKAPSEPIPASEEPG
jgi:hypothetical protein